MCSVPRSAQYHDPCSTTGKPPWKSRSASASPAFPLDRFVLAIPIRLVGVLRRTLGAGSRQQVGALSLIGLYLMMAARDASVGGTSTGPPSN